ncbi:Ribosomal 50S subunit-recycling heat shock protein [Commensalibacter communis]|uniref:Contains S4 domain (HslR) n=1 Tax=Commensalibacter communis TaxID=2972786 RepID=A0A9W4X9X9_9PROT|nr:Ribosomal 50S subunit-recycling heat shock protein [Commensalibacter communis]CAI3923568.1 Ribosomal 50S subunit-recycling heat shock protein [Commensalibacter communis]CAI3935723.1 Ribosomal 50S subunit-recycling heat shock protein [Commensalibacter communis]CAI3945413.1 Ribosomal 50S subunit-recycling heat shock protein [Commensalibacter communis]CAI3947099.1 Ribosomal 50S subunit-recycling heat shock protein [Commensalibacter communis]
MIDFECQTQRIDLWLWHARIYKTRSISTKYIQHGAFRLNSCPVTKASCTIKKNDILTFVWYDTIRVIKILNLTKQRVAAKNISLIYQEILETSDVKL